MTVNIRALIDNDIAEREREGDFPLQLKFVRRNGRPFKAQALPKGIAPAALGECFTTATLLKGRLPHMRYVEGYAVPPNEPWLHHHAWVVDQANRVVDATWPAPESTTYFGVVIPNVMEIMFASGHTGVFEKEKGIVFHEWMFSLDPALKKEAAEWESRSVG